MWRKIDVPYECRGEKRDVRQTRNEDGGVCGKENSRKVDMAEGIVFVLMFLVLMYAGFSILGLLYAAAIKWSLIDWRTLFFIISVAVIYWGIKNEIGKMCNRHNE